MSHPTKTRDRGADGIAAEAAWPEVAAPLGLLCPALIAIGGLSGTGKSALARRLATSLASAPVALVLRSDIERKRMFGIAETERLPSRAYSGEATRRVYARLADEARRALEAGRPVIVDAVFARHEEREAIAALTRACGVPFCGLFLVAELAVRLERIAARQGDASDADARVAREQEHYDIGTIDWTRIDAAGPPEAVLAAALKACAAAAMRHGGTATVILRDAPEPTFPHNDHPSTTFDDP
jgi:uncharacterized protein